MGFTVRKIQTEVYECFGCVPTNSPDKRSMFVAGAGWVTPTYQDNISIIHPSNFSEKQIKDVMNLIKLQRGLK